MNWQQLGQTEHWIVYNEQGRALCSTRDPHREALAWVELCGDLSVFAEVWVFGIGAGFHIEALAKKYPSLKIQAMTHYPVSDLRTERLSCHSVQLNESACEQLLSDRKMLPQGPVLLFRPAAHADDIEFVEVARAKDKDSFTKKAQSLGFRKLASFVMQFTPKSSVVNIHELVKQKSAGSFEEKIVLTLRELVK